MINKKEKEIKKPMKKRTLLSMLLAGIMAVSLVGCGDDGKTNNNNNFADKFQPTTNTAVDATEVPSGDPVTPYEPGASGPTNSQVETPTPEPEKNVITLMSADGKKIIHEFDIPDGYTVVSDKKGNHIELAKNEDDELNIKIEIYSGLNSHVLSARYAPVSTAEKRYWQEEVDYYSTSNRTDIKTVEENIKETTNRREQAKKEFLNESGIDIKYLNESLSDVYRKSASGYMYDALEEYHAAYMNHYQGLPCDANYWDDKNYDDDPYTFTMYYYHISDFDKATDISTYLPENEHFTIKITTCYDKNDYLHYDTLSKRLFWFTIDSQSTIDKFINTFDFNLDTHKCDHCK